MKRHASMNRAYRLIWSPVLNAWIAVAENARGRGKGTARKLIAAALLLFPGFVLAAPTGGQVVSGSGSITQAGTTTTITQASQNLSVNWQSFNTTAQETVNFVQPSASSIAVNRIFDTNGTQFYGHLNANGQVYLINPNGILFGPGAQVNVGGLVASTLDFNDADLANTSRPFKGPGTGSVINQGTINGRYVALIGNTVRNEGTITTPQGMTALGAGSAVTLTFADTSLVKMQVDQNTLNNLAENGGLIQADGGMVLLSAGAKNALLASVVNNTGVIEARSVQNVNGTIVLDGGNLGAVSNSGTLDASGKNAGETGGTVKVLGQQVDLQTGTKIDVSGDAGGGTALIGGNFHGAGPEQNATTTNVATGASINADAITNGDGGNIAVWSDEHTTVDGTFSARGGANGGNGGQVETSGKKLTIGDNTRVTTLAPQGTAGGWLLDPVDFTIYGTGDPVADMSDSTLSTNLGGGNVTILSSSGSSGSNGDIIVTVNAFPSWTAATKLTLSAYHDVTVNGFIDASGGNGSIELRADNTGKGAGTVNIGGSSYIGSGGGTIDIYYNPTSYASPTNYATTYAGNISGTTHEYMALNISASVANKTYDGTTNGSVSGVSVMGTAPDGVSSGQVVTINTAGATATFNNKNVGNNKATTIGGITLGGADAGKYYLNGLDSKTANITPKALTQSGLSVAASKTYDGTTAATVSGTAALQATEAAGTGTTSDGKAYTGDTVSLTGTATGTYNSKNVATASSVTYGGLSLTGADAGNYTLTMQGNSAATITQASLTVTASQVTKTYDGGTSATGNGSITSGSLGTGDVVNAAATQAFLDKNAGTNKTVRASGLTIKDGSNADMTGNYNISYTDNTTSTINQKAVTLTAPTVTKTYDGGTTYTTTAGNLTTLSGSLVGGDTVTAATIAYADKNAGTGNKTANLNAATISDGNSGNNYSVTLAGNTTSTINQKAVTLTAPTVIKTYDGGLTYTTTAGDLTALAGSLVGSDTVTAATIAYADKNAGSGNKTANLNAVTISDGNSGNNYSVTLAGNTASTINQKALTLGGITASNKTYDGTTSATLNTAGVTFSGLVGGDTVTLGGAGVGNFADKNVGTGKTVTVSGYTLGGADAANYSVGQPTGLTADITPASISVSGITAANKTYDGSTSATVNTAGAVFTGKVGGDAVTVSTTGTFADKNVGIGKTVTLASTYGGADAGNYTFTDQANTTANITAKAVTLTAPNVSKTYDGGLAYTVSNADKTTLSGSLVGGDTVTGATIAYTDKNVGAGNKTVNFNAVTINDGNGGNNYSVTLAGNSASTINQANLSVTANNASKTYDGVAYSGGNGVTYSGFVGGETSAVLGGTLAYGGTSQGAVNTGTYTITPSGLTGSNYALSFVDGVLTINSATPPTPSAPPIPPSVIPHIPPPPPAALSPVLTVQTLAPPSGGATGSGGLPGNGNTSGNGGASGNGDTPGNGSGNSSDEGRGTVTANTVLNIGGTGPTLFIMNGGMKLPDNMIRTN